MRVLGIDPSSLATGYGIVEFENGAYTVLGYGTIRPSRKASLAEKLHQIKSGIDLLIRKHEPAEVAIENPFYAQNIKTALTLGQVRGAVLVSIAGQGKPLFEYSPLEIKKAVTGYGRAEKIQVKTMIRALLEISDPEIDDDASDALACALCHINTRLYQRTVEGS